MSALVYDWHCVVPNVTAVMCWYQCMWRDRCGPKGQAGDKGGDKASGDKEEEEKPTLDKAVWEAKLKYLQVSCFQHVIPVSATP